MKHSIRLMLFWTALFSFHASALSVGDKAPGFSLTTISDSTVSLSEYQGQVQVLFFFGCG